MTIHRIRENENGTLVIITPAGNVARTSSSDAFITTDRGLAEESLAYLTQTTQWPAKPAGSHRMKSLWGTIL